MPEERLQKILSQTGVASRRKSEELIVAGRVSVNGKTVTELGSKADLETDHIKVDGRLLHAPERHVYIALNKPKEVMTTVSDPQGRETVMKFMRGIKERVYPVGRLDYHSEGLLILTNDGEFAHRIMAPQSQVVKTYVVKVNGVLTLDQEKGFREGLPVHGKKTEPAELKLIKRGANPWYEVKITEGRQNQIRLMFQHLGRLVEKLRRVKIGFLELDVPPGRYRLLDSKEVLKFKRLLQLDGSPASGEVSPEATDQAAPKQQALRQTTAKQQAPKRQAPKQHAAKQRPPQKKHRTEPAAPRQQAPNVQGRPEHERPAQKRPAQKRPGQDRPDQARPRQGHNAKKRPFAKRQAPKR
jgi:23S rRNA pseudouridine2605 synthase